ncbi:MAG: hypothetical protein LBB73_00750 [Dysgonamonadaceae bacterium]|jgi:hypothetical protein|nr:hypothetical protein [Dysgonamonadaceae bacterium]
MSDWMQRNHTALYNQATQTMDYMTAPGNFVRMGFAVDSPQREWFDDVFDPACTAFFSAYKAWENPSERTPLKTTDLDVAEKGFKPEYRRLYTGFLKTSPLVTDHDLEAMGMPKRSTERKPSQVAGKSPNCDVDTSLPAHLIFRYYEKDGDHKRAKPEGQHGVEIAWSVTEIAPTKWSELTHSSFDTHSPFTLKFESDQSGKSVYFSLRWENTRGEKGPWSPITKVIIP